MRGVINMDGIGEGVRGGIGPGDEVPFMCDNAP